MHVVGTVSRCALATNQDGSVMQFQTGRRAGQDIINFSIEGQNFILGDSFQSLSDLPKEGQQVAITTETRYKAGSRPLVIMTHWQSYSPFR